MADSRVWFVMFMCHCCHSELSQCSLTLAHRNRLSFQWSSGHSGGSPIAVLWSVALWSIHINIILDFCLRYLPHVGVKPFYLLTLSKYKRDTGCSEDREKNRTLVFSNQKMVGKLGIFKLTKKGNGHDSHDFFSATLWRRPWILICVVMEEEIKVKG